MSTDKSPLELWLAEISAESDALSGSWDPGFDSGRQVVIATLGPWRKIFQRPIDFIPRFYHQSFPLPIDEWHLNSQIKLYGDFCVIDALVTIRYQATIAYAHANLESLPTINQHIKSRCQSLIQDTIEHELRQLAGGEWIERGLGLFEHRIEIHINEALTFQGIQCRTVCELLATFKEAADPQQLDSRFAKDNLYLKILKKNFEVQEQQNKERIRQEMVLEQQRLDRQQRLIDQYNQEQALHRIEQEQAALNQKRRLEEQERQLNEQFMIEERVHREQIFHQQNLKRLEMEVTAQTKQEIQTKEFETEQRLLQERLEHEKKLKEIELANEIAAFEKKQQAWSAVQERLKIDGIEQERRIKELEHQAELVLLNNKQSEEQKLQEQLLLERMRHEARLKALELDMQLQEHEKRYAANQKLDQYLRRDIELLILEKHREDLAHEIKKARMDDTPSG